jgi:glycerol-3-phosphate dehydrogenase
MRRDLDRLTRATFDLLVVGGGIHGLAAAYDAVQRGLTVALVERDDFGSGASFNNLRTVHGGLRSLQTGDLRKFRLSIRERRTFARIAPHLVEPLAFLLPTTRSLTRGRAALTVAFTIDALLGADRNRDLPPRLHLPRGRTLSRAECVAIDPLLDDQDITGGALWYDYQMPRTERLTLAFAHAAAEAVTTASVESRSTRADSGQRGDAGAAGGAGAALANYVEALEVLWDGRRVQGARVRDRISGETFDVRARVLLNAAGAGLPALLAASHITHPRPLALQKAINLVTTRPMPSGTQAGQHGPVAIGGSHAGGTLIRVPWRERAVIGTWHSTAADAMDAAATAHVSTPELDRVIADINATFPGFKLDREEVTLVHRGLVPAYADAHGAMRMQSESLVINHTDDNVDGLFSIRGAKYTTARAVAEAAIDHVERRIGRSPTPSRTASTPLPGAPTEADIAGALADEWCRAHPLLRAHCAQHLTLAYGTRGRDVLALTRDMPALVEPIDSTHPAIRAEVLYAVREEMALTLTDVVARRIQIGVGGYPGDRAARCCAEIMRDECNWSDARMHDELHKLREFYEPV